MIKIKGELIFVIYRENNCVIQIFFSYDLIPFNSKQVNICLVDKT
jgi:hypothetical protein